MKLWHMAISKPNKGDRFRFYFPVALLLIFLLAINFAYARSVEMDLAFRIGGNKDNTIHVNGTDTNATSNVTSSFTDLEKKFISAERNRTFLGLVFAGSEFLNISFNTSYSANDFLLTLSQDDNQNRFLIAVSNGTSANIEDKMADVGRMKLISSVFGNILFSTPSMFDFFIRLEYRDVDLANRIRFDGATKLLIKNSGKIGKLHNISVEVIR